GNNIRLIVSDIKMPGMDGLEFLKKVREDYGEDIGVTMLTAYEDADKWDKATAGFVINYLRKPLDRTQLIETIDNYFSGQGGDMVLQTFEKHIEKREEFKKKPENKA
ncbi:MAG: response regulator, partial [Candidatus Margulisiibacteriota bacterium]